MQSDTEPNHKNVSWLDCVPRYRLDNTAKDCAVHSTAVQFRGIIITLDLSAWQIGAAEAIGIIAAIVSLVAASVSWLYSHRSYALAFAQEKRKQASTSCSFHNLLSHKDGENGRLGILVTLSNNSENPNFVASAKLQTEYAVRGVPVTLVVDATSPCTSWSENDVGLACPVNLGGLASVRGWFEFYLSEQMIQPVRRALNVQLVVADAAGNSTSILISVPRAFNDLSSKTKPGSSATST